MQLANAIAHMDRNANSAALVCQGAGNSLPNPPGGVGAKFVAAAVIKLFNGFHQAEVAFLNQIRKGDALSHIFLGNANDQTGVGFYEMIARPVTIPNKATQPELVFLGIEPISGQSFLGLTPFFKTFGQGYLLGRGHRAVRKPAC